MKAIFYNHGYHIDEKDTGGFDNPAIVKHRGVLAVHRWFSLVRVCCTDDQFVNIDVWLKSSSLKAHEAPIGFNYEKPVPGKMLMPLGTLMKIRKLEANDPYLTGQLCPHCGNPGEYRGPETKYGPRFAGYPRLIVCTGNCDSYTSCHRDTLLAKGTMADLKLRQLRKKIHGLIDPLWKKEPLDFRSKSIGRRKALYQAFGEMMGMKEFHVAHLDRRQAESFLDLFYTEPWALRVEQILSQ